MAEESHTIRSDEPFETIGVDCGTACTHSGREEQLGAFGAQQPVRRERSRKLQKVTNG